MSKCTIVTLICNFPIHRLGNPESVLRELSQHLISQFYGQSNLCENVPKHPYWKKRKPSKERSMIEIVVGEFKMFRETLMKKVAALVEEKNVAFKSEAGQNMRNTFISPYKVMKVRGRGVSKNPQSKKQVTVVGNQQSVAVFTHSVVPESAQEDADLAVYSDLLNENESGVVPMELLEEVPSTSVVSAINENRE